MRWWLAVTQRGTIDSGGWDRLSDFYSYTLRAKAEKEKERRGGFINLYQEMKGLSHHDIQQWETLHHCIRDC